MKPRVVPRLVVAGLSGDSGKTLVCLGLARTLQDRGMEVRAFKKGPDYIDAAWLAAATGAPCRNLDTFFMSDEAIRSSVAAQAAADFILVEGNRGLYDGFDAAGSHSTAELAKRIDAPVVLVVNVTKTTRTAAALVLGCREMDLDVRIAGVILNRVATARQEALIRQAVEDATGIEVVGAVPRLGGDDPLPGRHLGLVTAVEHPLREESIKRAAGLVASHVDLDRLRELASTAPAVRESRVELAQPGPPVRLGYFSDQAFSFYYPENLEQLTARGAQLVAVSPQSNRPLPEIDGLYIGGGFPEVHAARLADSADFARSLRERVDRGMPVYAECGGLMYLARELVVDGTVFPMAGVLDLVVEQTGRPQGHGYEVGVIDRDNPFFATGTELRGHEFHYSRVVGGVDRQRTVMRVDRGCGIGDSRDGLVAGNVWASYLHLHALGSGLWADGFLAMAVQNAGERAGSVAAWA